MSDNKQLAKQASKGYNYTYTSLADFAKQGFTIPKMRTVVTEFGEYVEYKDEDGAWQQGAKVVPLDESKSMNACQRYGAALTYSRRYTVAMALGVATDDDDAVENHGPIHKAETAGGYKQGVNFTEIKNKVATINDLEELENYYQSLKLTPGQTKIVIPFFSDRKKEIAK